MERGHGVHATGRRACVDAARWDETSARRASTYLVNANSQDVFTLHNCSENFFTKPTKAKKDISPNPGTAYKNQA